VDRVGQQRHRAGEQHHGELGDRCGAEDHEADRDGADARAAGLHGVVDGVRGVVAVGGDDVRQPRPHPCEHPGARLVLVPVSTSGVVLVAAGGRCRHPTSRASGVSEQPDTTDRTSYSPLPRRNDKNEQQLAPDISTNNSLGSPAILVGRTAVGATVWQRRRRRG
jgi:hypothetical protein